MLFARQIICITFVQCWTNVKDVVGSTLYKCFTNVFCLLGCTLRQRCSIRTTCCSEQSHLLCRDIYQLIYNGTKFLSISEKDERFCRRRQFDAGWFFWSFVVLDLTIFLLINLFASGGVCRGNVFPTFGQCWADVLDVQPFNRRCRIYSGFHFLLAH